MNEKISGSRSKKQRLTAVGTRCADHVTPLYPQKLALTSPTGGGRSVGIVRVRTKATELVYVSRGRYSSIDQIFTSLLEVLRLRMFLFIGHNCASTDLFLAYNGNGLFILNVMLYCCRYFNRRRWTIFHKGNVSRRISMAHDVV